MWRKNGRAAFAMAAHALQAYVADAGSARPPIVHVDVSDAVPGTYGARSHDSGSWFGRYMHDKGTRSFVTDKSVVTCCCPSRLARSSTPWH